MREQVKLVRERKATAQSRQKSYADVRIRELTFEEGDCVYLKVSPMKGMKRFGLKGKLTPRYIGPYMVLEKLGLVAYKVELPEEDEVIHNVFHIFLLRKGFWIQQLRVISRDIVLLQPNLTYEARLERIVDWKEQTSRSKIVPLVKVQWGSPGNKEFRWENEGDNAGAFFLFI